MPRLVILAPNWLGDAVMALPAIADVRRGLAAAHITVAARAAVVPLFQLVADVDDTIVLGRGASLARVGSWGQMGAELRNHGFATALLLPNSIHAALLAYRAGIRERWGYGGGVRAQWLTRAVPRIRGGHQADYYRHLVAALGFSNGDREPRISVPEPMRAAAEQLLRDSIARHLDELGSDENVMLKLSIPAEPGLFTPLVQHPKVLRVVALSGGFSRADACRELAKNPGMIASFSRALLSDLRAQQSDEEFNRTLGEAIDEIYEASTDKVSA